MGKEKKPSNFTGVGIGMKSDDKRNFEVSISSAKKIAQFFIL